MAWVYLDDQFPNHPKVVLAGGDASWLFVCGMAYTKRYNTKGAIPKAQVPMLSDRKNPRRLAAKLVDVILWIDEGDHYMVHDYDEWNKPQDSRSEAGRKAARARWGTDASSNANASRSHDPPHERTHYESQYETDADRNASECPAPSTPSDLHLLPATSGVADAKTMPGRQAAHTLTRAKDAALVLAHRQIADRVAARKVADPAAVAHKRAEEDLWPTLGARLISLAENHPKASAKALADRAEKDEPEPPTEPPTGPALATADEQRRQRAAELPERDDRVNSSGLAEARQHLRQASSP